MKTSLIAAAVLATLAGAASAQSSVTLYGIADAWVGQMDNKVGATPTGRISVVESGGAQASRWGLRGSEDLGSGLSAKFVIEQGFAIDQGTVSTVSGSNIGFNRAAYVGLVGGFGEARFGRMLSAYDALRGSNNQLYDSSGFASTGQVWSAGATAGDNQAAVKGSDYLARGNNTAWYKTPQWGPFIASVSVALGEGATTESAAPRLVTGHVEYTSGAVRVGYAFQDERYATGHNKFDMIAGRYNFGFARLVANYQQQDDERVAGGQKSKEYQIGVDAPFGAATVAVGYAKAVTRNGDGVELVDASGLSALGTYALSKRTRLYTGIRRLAVERGDGSATLKQTRYGVGFTHTF